MLNAQERNAQRARKRRAQVVDDDDEEEEVEEEQEQAVVPTRASKRQRLQKQHPDYLYEAG